MRVFTSPMGTTTVAVEVLEKVWAEAVAEQVAAEAE